MIRTVLILVLSALSFANPFTPALGQEAKERSKKDTPIASLKVGDSAPPLKANKWLQGNEITKFEAGKVYVIDFWAPWCGACIRHLPHLAELQARYKDQGVTAIAFTSRDIRGVPDNTEEKSAAFLKKRGAALPITFAYADNGTTTDAWLKAAGQEGFCTFVVDKTGRIAFMGSPMYLDMVLPKVLARASAKAVGEEIAQVDADYRAAAAALKSDSKPEAFFRALGEFEAKYPALADFMPAACIKLNLWILQGKTDEAKEYADLLIAKAIKQHNAVVLEMAYAFLRSQDKSKELSELAVRAAEALVRFDGGKEPHSLLRLADAYLASGDKAKAKQCAGKAIDAAAGESAADRQDIEKEARRLGVEN
ncbi:MAG TPA: TlpA family protein disulfide reductase [Gemmataceae bacterium]|jgi:thiol-disulfide isomerase/thioredoxin